MSARKTVRISAHDAALAFYSSMPDDHVAQRQAEDLVRVGKPMEAVKRAAFANSDNLIGAIIKDRIAYSDTSGDLYVKPNLLDDAISALTSIAVVAGTEAERLGGPITARRKLGKDPEAGDEEKVAAVRTLEQHAGVILALASGARILSPTHVD